jgi:hypothetical protein
MSAPFKCKGFRNRRLIRTERRESWKELEKEPDIGTNTIYSRD